MQQLPFILMALGVTCIIISFFLPDKEKRADREKKENLTPEDRANLIAEGKKEIDGIFNNRAEDTIERVDEQLSRISNEKIISVSEYSDQVLEKINQNHQEVVFLYNMLNEKEEEMKKMMSRMKMVSKEDTPGGKQEGHLAQRAQNVLETAALQKSQTAFTASMPSQASALLSQIEETDSGSFEAERFQGNEDMEMLRGLIYEDEAQISSVLIDQDEQNISQKALEPEQGEERSLPEQILTMYQNGMSVLEISKALHKGQGEVRLIIELYARNKR